VGKSTFFSGQPVFNQLLELIPRGTVSDLSAKFQTNHYYKRFMTWDHLVSMLYCSFQRCSSLRELMSGLLANYNKLEHLGLKSIPRRSTLADANSRRNPEFFEELYHKLFLHLYGISPDSRSIRRYEDRLFLLDSTTIQLFTDIMKAAGTTPANGKRKGGAKAHVLLKAAEDIPALIKITPSAKNDKYIMRFVNLPPGSILVFDRAYHHFQRWKEWGDQGITWITRYIDREAVEILENRPLSIDDKKADVLKDRKIILGSGTGPGSIRIQVRMIEYKDREKKRTFTFLTNNFKFSARAITQFYKKRWRIETFFKRLKQNNPLHYFLGDNETAVKIQIWCSFIADLLIKAMKDGVRKKWSFSNLAGIVRHHLMNYFNLISFLKSPEKALINWYSSSKEKTEQLSLFKNMGASP